MLRYVGYPSVTEHLSVVEVNANQPHTAASAIKRPDRTGITDRPKLTLIVTCSMSLILPSIVMMNFPVCCCCEWLLTKKKLFQLLSSSPVAPRFPYTFNLFADSSFVAPLACQWEERRARRRTCLKSMTVPELRNTPQRHGRSIHFYAIQEHSFLPSLGPY